MLLVIQIVAHGFETVPRYFSLSNKIVDLFLLLIKSFLLQFDFSLQFANDFAHFLQIFNVSLILRLQLFNLVRQLCDVFHIHYENFIQAFRLGARVSQVFPEAGVIKLVSSHFRLGDRGFNLLLACYVYSFIEQVHRHGLKRKIVLLLFVLL